MKNLTTTVLLLLVSTFLHAQSIIPITRIDGVGAGNNFLKLSEETRLSILNNTFDGEITYLPDHGPIKITVTNPNNFTIGDYELTLIDEELTNDMLDLDVFWQLTHIQSGTTVVSDLTITAAPEQAVPEFGISVEMIQTVDPGKMGPNNGALGISLEYEDSQGPQWFSGIPDGYHPEYLNYIVTEDGEVDEALDPNQDLSSLGEGLFVPYTLCNWRSTFSSYGYISPSWFNAFSEIVRVGNPLDSLNNVNVVFTADKNLWSRCVILETASPEYYHQNGLGLATEENTTQGCEVVSIDLRGALSVGPDDANLDGLPDPDGDTYMGEPRIGMGWFPGYAIDVETGKRLNILFGENSTYSLDLDSALLEQYDISSDDFDTAPTGRDMLWNPTSQKEIEAGDSDGFPYQYYLGGQHFVYVTRQEYDECEFLYEKLNCSTSSINKVNALRRLTWTAMPVLAEGTSLLPLAEGLIPNDLTIKLRVDNPFQVRVGTGQLNGYPTYQFEVNEESVSVNSPQQASWTESVFISPNPTRSADQQSLQLHNLPDACTISLYNLTGQQLLSKDFSGIPSASVVSISSTEIPSLNKGIYFVRIQQNDRSWKVLKWVVV